KSLQRGSGRDSGSRKRRSLCHAIVPTVEDGARGVRLWPLIKAFRTWLLAEASQASPRRGRRRTRNPQRRGQQPTSSIFEGTSTIGASNHLTTRNGKLSSLFGFASGTTRKRTRATLL